MFRRVHAFWLAAIVMMAANMVAQAPPAFATTGEIGFSGSAFGTEVTVSTVVQSGRSALSVLGCTAAAGLTHTNTVASVSTPVLSTGTIDTSTASQATSTGVAATSSATTQSVSLLGGVVTADTIQSVSTTSRDSASGTFSTSAAGTQFVNLVVAGVPITTTPAPNTRINLPGIGYVILNQQTGAVSTRQAHLTVVAIHLVVTLSTPLAQIGTQILVSDASSGLGGPVAGLLSGLSYGASANVASTVIAGPEFPQPLACFGTAGAVKTNSGAALSIPAVLTSGTVADTAEGVANRRHASAETTSTVQGLNLLNGLVTATVIKADVTANGNPPSLGDTSTFLNLAVSGFPGIGDTPPPNTRLTLPGLGTLWLHKRITTANSITVIMVQLDVTVPDNPAGLAPGTTVNVAYAKVGIG